MIGSTDSSSAPSVTRIALSGWNCATTSSSCAAMARSERMPTFSSPVRMAISTSSSSGFFSRILSWAESAPSIAFVSLSSGSAIPSFRAAVNTCLRPMTGPRIAVLMPRSLSRSTVKTSVLAINNHRWSFSPNHSPNSKSSRESPNKSLQFGFNPKATLQNPSAVVLLRVGAWPAFAPSIAESPVCTLEGDRARVGRTNDHRPEARGSCD